MTARIHSLLLAALLAAGSQAVLAQTKLQAGLWEHTMQMKSGSGQMEGAMAKMQAQLAAMPPAQRQQVEAMMARNGAAMGSAPNTVRLCLSKENAERGEPPQGDGRCKQEVLQRSGSTIKFRFSCSGNPPSTGEGEYQVSGPTAFSGHSVINTVVQGKPERMEMTQTGKWLSADCGSLQPRP